MPSQTTREEAAEALHCAYLLSLIVEAEAQLDELSSDESDQSTSSTESEDSEPLVPASGIYLEQLTNLYSRHYHQERETINKTGENLTLLLTDWKYTHSEIFRSYVRVTPACFDKILEAIRDDEVFHNSSQNEQDPVERQLAVTLFRFGHFGNAASMMKVALWAGVGYGTVRLYTTRVMAAICSKNFRRAALRWPDEVTKENAKCWVEEASCPAWRDGWLMVDGTLVPLFQRPAFYGNSWFDRKQKYSMNVQVQQSLY